MKPFNVDQAKQGASVCNAFGRDIRIVSFDPKNDHPFLCEIKYAHGESRMERFDLSGLSSSTSEQLLMK